MIANEKSRTMIANDFMNIMIIKRNNNLAMMPLLKIKNQSPSHNQSKS